MYDLVVVGGGPAGVTAALRARELGATVALVEKDRIGGTCTNDGCVPTRVLARTARHMRNYKQFKNYGLELDCEPRLNMKAAIARVHSVVQEVHDKKQLVDHLQDVRIATFTGVGNTWFEDANTLMFENGGQVSGDNFILCVGGRPRRLDMPGGEYAITHLDVWEMEELPPRIAIVGSGATGCQFTSIFVDFGAEVTLLEINERILVREDPDIGTEMAYQFKSKGVNVVANIGGLQRIEKNDADGDLTLVYLFDGKEEQLRVDAVMISAGWPGSVAGLKLENAGVELDRHYVKVNDRLQTTAPHIYAAGDITGRSMLVQSASNQARIAVENALLGQENDISHHLVPHGGFTDPEYGSVGQTEAELAEQYNIISAKVPFGDLDRAVIDARTKGFLKLIVCRETHRVLAAHAVGEQALEIVSMVSAGMAGDLRVEQLADLELAYPTYSSIIGLAARQIVRELGMIPLAPVWRALAPLRATEWERRDVD
jgi:pyruvate/2-oxoglutarate dehydrogenase complex dihydrolipoamide dehydrogenase (E3) component